MHSAYVTGKNYRFTLLTPGLIRLEYSPSGRFENRPTQVVVDRDFPVPEYRLWRTAEGIELHTDRFNLFYNEAPFSPNGLWIENRSECSGIYCTWHFGDPLKENLGGTTRTLDEADGPIPLENGLFSRLEGYSVLDDSASYALTRDGWLEAPEAGHQDLYVFCYGCDYRQALRDFFQLCGPTPLLPRYALGNWWSRYHPYSDETYLSLMDRFRQEGIPLSVAVLDMDWHISQDGPDWKGWTGYTWNPALFPQPKAFLDELHRLGLHVTLNLHPAEGIQPHEEIYPAMADALGKDARRRQRIPFDPADRQFLTAYFQYAHHPREAEGVDFWWIDWQQGGTCSLPGLDPLWVLNHFHTLDIGRGGKRPLILSRYAGPGSHRYPIGFSGDSVISWRSLAFQPYFTATAANIGYGWWSHDIGGHTHGKRDDELQVRWLQWGVFSPILRMHSTSNPFNSKEPWRYGLECQQIMTHFLRLRHRLLPYLYTMNWRCHTQGEMLVQPMYYLYPHREEAYQVPNQYFFGSELVAAPITQPMSPCLQMGYAVCWLPEGIYHDLFTGVIYQGGGKRKLYRPLASIPVLAKAGAILPLLAKAEDQSALPSAMEIRVFVGADGDFCLYEDDGETMDYRQGQYRTTRLRFVTAGDTRFIIEPDHLWAEEASPREYTLSFMGAAPAQPPEVTINGNPTSVCATYRSEEHTLTVPLPPVAPTDTVVVTIPGGLALARNNAAAYWEALLNRAQMAYELKAQVMACLEKPISNMEKLRELQAMGLPGECLDSLCEVMED